MHSYLFSFVLIFAFVGLSYEKNLPSYIKRCKYTTNGKILGECVKNVFIDLKDKFISGIPEMHIPVLDPFEINEIDFNTGSGSSIGLESRFSNVKISYTKNVILENVNIDIPNVLCTIELKFPMLRLTTNYNLTGQIMIMQLNGTGNAEGNFTDIRSDIRFKGHFVRRHNKEYVEWTDRKLNLTIAKASMHFDDLFHNNKELTEATNKMINENYDEIIRERVFHTFSVEELFIK
ncbi:uncharacterized protein CBL_06220 [Carabus blaptoides fortunei]